ncbi:MAG: beta-galactosidase, partial [Lentisphaeria bacterium]|nr:beta-galactosidase [Lentisphaeria bacterium]
FNNSKFTRSFENFRDAGLHQYVMGIFLSQIWKGPGQYAFNAIDQWAEETFLRDPEARLIFEIAGRSIPSWWTEKHPEECVKYLNLDEKYKNNTDQLRGRFLAPSFASELYLKELSEFLRAMIEYIESKPWAKRVFAYRNDNGVYLEWHYWGMDCVIPDVSAPMQRHFTKFLRERYGTDEALQEAWNNPDVTIDTARLADYEQRTTTHEGCYWDPIKDAQAIDSVRCTIDAVANFMLTTNHVIKEACNRRALVGNYYGYFFGMGFPAVGWHLLLDKVLDSSGVDFNCQPRLYGQPFRDFGEGQFSRGLVSSYALHGKLNLIEADTRTTDVPYDNPHCFAKDINDTINLLTRDFSQALCTGAGFWYFDFGEGWYTAPETREYLAKLKDIWNEPNVDNSSAAEVLLVCDMASIYYQSSDNPEITVRSFIDHNRKALSHVGVPYDTILLEDLDNPNLRQDYKVYIFMNTLMNSPERTAIAQKLRDAGKTIVWLDRAGLFQEHASADENSTEALTGFSAKKLDKNFIPMLVGLDGATRRGNYHTPTKVTPQLAIIDEKAEALGHTDGDVTFARKRNANGGYSYLATMPFLQPRDYLAIFKEAGVHIYCEDENAALFANRSHIMLHVDQAGPRLLTLPQPCRLIQLLPEHKVISEHTQEIQIDAASRTTYLFRME